jgi:hypothetical protein
MNLYCHFYSITGGAPKDFLKCQEECKYRTVGEAVKLGSGCFKHYGTTAKNKNAAKMIK